MVERTHLLVDQTCFFLRLAKKKVFLRVCHQEGPATSQKCRIASLQEGMLKKKVERTHLLVDQTHFLMIICSDLTESDLLEELCFLGTGK